LVHCIRLAASPIDGYSLNVFSIFDVSHLFSIDYAFKYLGRFEIGNVFETGAFFLKVEKTLFSVRITAQTCPRSGEPEREQDHFLSVRFSKIVSKNSCDFFKKKS
jgi:hypothetical protein